MGAYSANCPYKIRQIHRDNLPKKIRQIVPESIFGKLSFGKLSLTRRHGGTEHGNGNRTKEIELMELGLTLGLTLLEPYENRGTERNSGFKTTYNHYFLSAE